MKKRKKNMEIETFIHESPSIRRFWNGIYSLLMRADARGSAYTICCMWRISLLCARAIVNDVTKSRSRTEYLLPTDCVIMFDSYFNFTKKSNLVGTL